MEDTGEGGGGSLAHFCRLKFKTVFFYSFFLSSGGGGGGEGGGIGGGGSPLSVMTRCICSRFFMRCKKRRSDKQ